MERRLKITAIKDLRYAGVSLVTGDDFEASDKDARILKAIGKARDYVAEVAVEPTPEPVKKAGTYRTRQMKAADVEPAEETDEPAVEDVADEE